MAVVQEEAGRLGDQVHRETRQYLVRDTPNEAQSLTDLITNPKGPPLFTDSGLERQPPELVQRLHSTAYRFRVQYLSEEAKSQGIGGSSPNRLLELGEFSLHFDGSGSTRHTERAMETNAYPDDGLTADDDFANKLNNIIRVRGKGPNAVVEGADVVAGSTMAFSLRTKLPRSQLTLKYAVDATKLVGHTNAEPGPPPLMPWIDHQFEPGEVLFTGWIGDLTKSLAPPGALVDQFAIYEFFYLAGRNRAAGELEFNPAMVAEAHDIIWHRLTPLEIAEVGTVSAPKYAIVQRVYDKADIWAPLTP